jgi:hypothetical protein
MGDTGSPYNLPFPELTDAPDVPQDIEDLATATHAEFAAIDSILSTVKPNLHTSDGSFPVEGSSTGEVDVIDRVTVASVAWARKLLIVGSVFHKNSQTMSNEINIFAGSTAKATAQEDLQADKGVQTTLVAAHDLAASTAVVIELRFKRLTGTGVSTTSAALYTKLLVLAIPT